MQKGPREGGGTLGKAERFHGNMDDALGKAEGPCGRQRDPREGRSILGKGEGDGT